MAKFFLFQTVLVFFFFGAVVHAQKLTILTVNEPPSSFANDHDEAEGFAIDVVREIQRRINNSDDIKILPEARAFFYGLNLSHTVLIGFSRTPDREDQFHWITTLFRKPWVLYSKRNSGIVIKSVEDAKKIKSIGVVRGDVRADFLKNKGFENIVLVTNPEQALEMLLKDRIQLFFYEPQGLSVLSKKLEIPISEFKAAFEAQSSVVWIMMSKRTSLNIVENWRTAAEQMKKDGTFQRIVEKWIVIFNQYGINCEFTNGILNFTL